MVEVVLLDDEIRLFIDKIEKDIKDILYKIDIENELAIIMKKIENSSAQGVEINNIYLYDGIEMYNFCRGTICTWLRDIIGKYLVIYEIFNIYNKMEISIVTDDIVYKDIITELFNINCKYIKKSENNKATKKRYNFKYNFMILNRVIRGLFFVGSKLLKNKKKDRIIFITQAADINTIEIKNNIINYDAQFGYVMDEIKRKKDVIRMQYLNSETVMDKSNKLGKDFMPFELFILVKRLYSNKLFDISKVKNSLDCLVKFDFSCKDKNLIKILEKHLFPKIEPAIKSYIMEIITARILLCKLKIDYVLATDEADRTRCIIWAANKLNLKTFAIQHGIISQVSTAYMIPTKSKEYVPYKTFLWGSEYKEQLLKNTSVYTNNNLMVVGQPRTDYLINKLKFLKSEDSHKSIRILYATQYVWDLTEEATKLFIEAIKDLNNIEVIIKLHPADKYQAFYEEIVEKYRLTNVKITKNMDIYEAIIWSDLVVSVHSTVVLEAAIINKPSICMLLSNYNDQGNFVKNGLSIGASNKEELKNIIENRLFYNSRLQDYIEESFYKVDGEVSRRILKYIQEAN